MINSFLESYMPPPHIAVLQEKVRRRVFLVRQRTKIKVKIRGDLTYDGVKQPEGYGFYTRKGRRMAQGAGYGAPMLLPQGAGDAEREDPPARLGAPACANPFLQIIVRAKNIK